MQALLVAAEKYREIIKGGWSGVVGDNGLDLDEAIRQCKEIDWSFDEIPGSMYASWQDITIGSGTRLVDCISKTEIEDISLTPEQIQRIDEISSNSDHLRFTEIIADLMANSERLPPEFDKAWADNVEQLYED